MTLQFGLLSEDGEDLGLVALAVEVWAPGDRIHRGYDTLEVVEVGDAVEGSGLAGYLVVKPA